MLKFSTLLRKLRKENNLSQADLVDALTQLEPELQNITVVTLSRWERDITEPPLNRMLKVLKYFNYDTIHFLKYINYIPSKNQVASFEKGLSKIIGWHLFGIFSIRDPDSICSIKFSMSNLEKRPLKYQLLNRINYVTAFNSGCRMKSLSKQDINSLNKSMRDGRLVALACEDTLNKSILAHGCNIVFDSNLRNFYKKKLDIRDLSIVDFVNHDTFEKADILVTPLLLFSEDWFKFFLKGLVELGAKHKEVDMIYMFVSRSEALKVYESIGFELVYSYKTFDTSKRFVVGCKFEKFITNHGFLKYIKSYL
ncbi:helix-turn-helix domain-containing protein [Vibrio owensii]|uniref:helix-turn-helix domain-containing protein n=1 Tax=Vibrio owensii TaxID=696485 RepID=UPI00221F21D8|nr:helix-turn-helix transcriptional regulator [Vibrio owensii]